MLSKKLCYLFDSVFVFIDLLVWMFMVLGLLVLVFIVLFGVLVVVVKLFGLVIVFGYVGIILMVLFFGVFNFLGFGIVGIYVWYVFENIKVCFLLII